MTPYNSSSQLTDYTSDMIPKLDNAPKLSKLYSDFLDKLARSGFKGDIRRDYAERITQSTDNSVYQLTPEAVLYPAGIEDIVILTRLASDPQYRRIQLSPRGGGTGTNGQSLTQGLMVDVSKYMNKVLEINTAERWARVQAGVVKDQLNAELKPHGLFFAPDLSTSNRATIGGMVNTDASGQGSCLYGKTRDHVLELKTILMDGSVLDSFPLDDGAFRTESGRQDRIGAVHRLVDAIDKEHAESIRKIFPPLNRCLTGYDLAHIRNAQGRFDLNAILCGSEGTLGFVAEAKLNLLTIPPHATLVVVKYADFDAALRDADELMQAEPTSIETVDSKVLNLAMQDFVWHQVETFFSDPTPVPVRGINLVEFTGYDKNELKPKVDAFVERITASISQSGERRIGLAVAEGKDAVNSLWSMRKRAVGLLGNADGEARPVPFVEDTAVPPDKLADYIAEFRRLLNAYGLDYGMFGHVDAGVLHVRPALDMKDPAQERLAWDISDKVAALTQKYGGLLWGEHGKGIRSHYAPAFFGELYPQLCRIKAAFDPYNQLNPGKIAAPRETDALLKIDRVATRGRNDRLIGKDAWQSFNEAVYCNGNAACFDWNPDAVMCPSWKATRERRYSPKGRASLLREWLKQAGEKGYSPADDLVRPTGIGGVLRLPGKLVNSLFDAGIDRDFSHRVYDSMAHCLACQSCTGQCPVKVDVPEFRAKFLYLYHTRYLRPPKDYLVGSLEFLLPVCAKFPELYNGLMQNPVIETALRKFVGFVDAPLLSPRLLHIKEIASADIERLERLSEDEKKRYVVIVQDAFTGFFEASLVADCIALLQALDFVPLMAPFSANGKPLHVHGFLHGFAKVAKNNAALLKTLADTGVALVGIDPAMTLCYRNEYVKYLGAENVPEVMLLQEFLNANSDRLATRRHGFRAGTFKLMPHCMEMSRAADSLQHWQHVFGALGQQLEVLKLGCCGMSGTFGHETRNRTLSQKVYDLSWQPAVERYRHEYTLVATGFSCRSQVERQAGLLLPHPLQALLALLKP